MRVRKIGPSFGRFQSCRSGTGLSSDIGLRYSDYRFVSGSRSVTDFILRLVLAVALLAATQPCACWATRAAAPKEASASSVEPAEEEDCCPCCRNKSRPSDQDSTTPEKPQKPLCPPGCFFCTGAVTPLTVTTPDLPAPEPALDQATTGNDFLAPQYSRDRLEPPPRG